MRPELLHEVERLKNILQGHGLELSLCEGAKTEDIARVESEVGITFDVDLKDFWQLTNGSGSEIWFAVFSDELTPCVFPSLEDARECWSWFLPYDESVDGDWSDDSAERDVRIKPKYLHHRLWFPVAEFNGYSTSVYFDGDPAEEGKYGQIIVYQHDPDAIYYVSESFLDFFRRSNELLEANAEEILL
jgi:cell wall assembly regulator SMI1